MVRKDTDISESKSFHAVAIPKPPWPIVLLLRGAPYLLLIPVGNNTPNPILWYFPNESIPSAGHLDISETIFFGSHSWLFLFIEIEDKKLQISLAVLTADAAGKIILYLCIFCKFSGK